MANWLTSIFSKDDGKKLLTSTARVDMGTVLYCRPCNKCMLRRDLDNGKCTCGADVHDVTQSPIGQAWLLLISPKTDDPHPGATRQL